MNKRIGSNCLIEEHQLHQNRDPLSVFMCAIKASETRRQSPRRLKVFFDFLIFNLMKSSRLQVKGIVGLKIMLIEQIKDKL
jgi:hypothetical protein